MDLQAYIKEIRRNGRRCFSINDLLEQFQISRNHARVALHRLLRRGDLISPARGLYVIVPPEHQSYGCIPAEELTPLLMAYLNTDYYVALLSAAAFHGAAHQKSAKFQVISSKRRAHPLVFGDVAIALIYKKSLAKLPTQDFTVSTGYLKVATPELTALDLLNYPEHAGGLNHIATVLSELVETLDADKLIELAKKIGAEYQLQRLGYILEKIDVMDEDKREIIVSTLAEFLDSNMKYYIPLASEIEKIGYPRSKKWKIIENTDVESDL
jgi:predicted transcriptional regulator of viral defense system